MYNALKRLDAGLDRMAPGTRCSFRSVTDKVGAGEPQKLDPCSALESKGGHGKFLVGAGVPGCCHAACSFGAAKLQSESDSLFPCTSSPPHAPPRGVVVVKMQPGRSSSARAIPCIPQRPLPWPCLPAVHRGSGRGGLLWRSSNGGPAVRL